jgi:4,5-DOPA dioxygenase extradiol
METGRKMPVIFTGHGSPMNAIDSNRARDGWRKMGESLGKPRVIIAVSAHWTTRCLCVRDSAENPQINDMSGFPPELYQIRYAPAGSPEYARRALELLGSGTIPNNDWGIDHGIWSVLCNMYPDADVPVVMVSTNLAADARAQFEAGRRLAPLREEGALILASGNVVHNLRMVGWDMAGGYDWADRFDLRIRDAVLSGDFETPVTYQALADAQKAVPTPEHYFPLLTALGAASSADRVTVWNEYRELGSMSMTSYLFEAQN